MAQRFHIAGLGIQGLLQHGQGTCRLTKTQPGHAQVGQCGRSPRHQVQRCFKGPPGIVGTPRLQAGHSLKELRAGDSNTN